MEEVQTPRLRVVDRFVSHGQPLTFRELCSAVLTPETRFLVLDLDRTVHFRRNMGELLGWEVVAYQAYGEDALDDLETRRNRSRFALDFAHPRQLAEYVRLGADVWALAGLHYLLWGKLAWRIDWLRRRAFRRSIEPVRAAQRVPQMALLRQIAGLPEATLRDLARRVWNRNEPDMVIDRDDLDWVRARCPDIQIVISSASPKPTVEVAAEELGVDVVAYSTLDRINSGEAKVARLRDLCPGLGEPGVEIVGITDTGYGEDHCWARYFTKVVDINSPDPFPAIVPADSPLQEVHSASVLTHAELRKRHAGLLDYLDPDRGRRPARRIELHAPELQQLLGGAIEHLEQLGERARQGAAKWELAYLRSRIVEASRAVLDGPVALPPSA